MWKDVLYWDGYIVSEEGEVARKDTGELLKQYKQKSGYVVVWLSRGSGRVPIPLHRIVCIAFHGEQGYIEGKYVDHINTNRSDNRACNLHWVTPKENSNNPTTRENVHRMLERKRQKRTERQFLETNKYADKD